MSSPTVTYTVSFLPTAVGQTVTLGPDTTAGVKRVVTNTLNLPAGAVLWISTQKIQVSAGAYYETDSSLVVSNAVAPSVSPSAGYQALQSTDPEMSPYGYQAVITYVSGTLPTTAITITLESV
jgi:hypothetical protein